MRTEDFITVCFIDLWSLIPLNPPFPRGTSADEALQNCQPGNFGERPPFAKEPVPKIGREPKGD